MNHRLSLAIIFSTCTSSVYAQQANPSVISAHVEEGKLTDEETQYFKKLKAYNKEFIFTNKVRRYYTNNADSSSSSVVNQLVFDKVDNLIAVNGKPTDYMAYDVSFVASGLNGIIINYTYSMGRALTGDGSAIINDQAVIETAYFCGASDNCSFEVKKNGVLMSAGVKPTPVAQKPLQKTASSSKLVRKFCSTDGKDYCILTTDNAGNYSIKRGQSGDKTFDHTYYGKFGGKSPNVVVSGNKLYEMLESDAYLEYGQCK